MTSFSYKMRTPETEGIYQDLLAAEARRFSEWRSMGSRKTQVFNRKLYEAWRTTSFLRANFGPPLNTTGRTAFKTIEDQLLFKEELFSLIQRQENEPRTES